MPDFSSARPAGRVDGWPRLLVDVVAEWRGRPFAWGERDCLGLCLASAKAITGRDVLGDLPGYSTEVGAAKHLRRLGFDCPADLVSAHLEEIPPARAARGDWVMIAGDGLVPGAFGVNAGQRSAHMGLDGLVMLPAALAVRAWKVN